MAAWAWGNCQTLCLEVGGEKRGVEGREKRRRRRRGEGEEGEGEKEEGEGKVRNATH